MPALTTLIIVAETVAMMVASMALSYVISALTAPDGLRGTSQTDPGVRSQVPPDTSTPVPVVYGSAYLGGRFVDACIREDQNVMYYVQAISCVSENGQFSWDTSKFYYGDRLITFDSAMPNRVVSLTDGAGNVDTSIDLMLYISLYTSDANGNITTYNTQGKMPWEALPPPNPLPDGDSVLMGVDSHLQPSQRWTSTGRRMNGLAFAIIRLSYSREAGTTQLQPITYHCTQNLFHTNAAKPGDVWYDYMTNGVYGAAVASSFVDSTSKDALNAYSDELITFNDYNGNPQTQPRYRINGVVDAGKAVLKNIDDIMQASDSWLRYEATTGLWSITINKAEEPVLALNDNNIIGSIVVGTLELSQTINVVEAKFPDSTNRDQYNYVNEFVPVDLLFPNEPINKQTLTYELVNNSVQALYLANRVLEQGREDLTITVNTTYVGIQLSAGDVVSITNSAYGWNNKLFRCMQVQEAVIDNSLGAQLQLSEYNAQVYDNFDITQFVPAPNTDLPSSYFFSALSAPTVVNPEPSAVIPVFDVACTVPATGRVTNINLYYTTVATPAVTDWILWGTQTLANSQPYAPNSTVLFDNLSLKPATYYFAFKVANETATSVLSPKSVAYVWNPSPSNSSTFVLSFSPATIQVPYVSGANLTGITFRLYGSTNLGEINFVASQTDSDVAFINNTWRIGDNANTGFGAITKSGIVVGNPTDGGNYAQFPQPTSMLGNPATVTVPARYKDTSGIIHQAASVTLQLVWNIQGSSGTSVATPTLYQWSTAYPSNPSGQSTYTWSAGTNTAYTGGGGWTTTIGSNSGVPLLQLYTCTKQITAPAGTTVSTVDWTSGYSIQSVSGNGAAGVQQASPIVYKWAITIPAAPTGTSSYVWSTGAFVAPSGWTTTPGTAPSAGYTLWGASVSLVESATVTTSTINWTTASITARGYAGTNGTNGTNGTDGTDGTNGASARICYTKTTLSSLASTPATITTSGSTSFPPANSWGTGTAWQATPPAIVAGESVYQSDGIYSPTTGNTVWNVPYLSALKVGNLSAISTNTGNLTVSGTIQASTAAISGTTMSGAGAVIYSDGRFAFGNASGNITYNASQTTINGDLVATGNVKIGAITIPLTQTITDVTTVGNGVFQKISEITLTNPYTANVLIMFNGQQVYTSGIPYNEFHIDIDYVTQTVRGGTAYSDYPTIMWSGTLSAGTHNIAVWWYGGSSGIQIEDRTLSVFGWYR